MKTGTKITLIIFGVIVFGLFLLRLIKDINVFNELINYFDTPVGEQRTGDLLLGIYVITSLSIIIFKKQKK